MMMTLDGFQEGVPVMSAKRKCGNLKANWFMSDMATQYFGAWSRVLNVENTQYLWCIWHVDHAWKYGLRHYDTQQRDQ